MSDEIDAAQLRDQEDTERAVNAARATCAAIPEGDPGICDWCGFEKERLVGGACAKCRDKYKLD
jgi:hypothetical protein